MKLARLILSLLSPALPLLGPANGITADPSQPPIPTSSINAPAEITPQINEFQSFLQLLTNSTNTVIALSKTGTPPPLNCPEKKMADPTLMFCVTDPAYIPVDVPQENIRLITSNIKVGLPDSQANIDIKKIFEQNPDFVTLQEVNSRSDSELTTTGYQIYRSMENNYTTETPVIWNSERWEKINSGTEYISTRKVKWGIRAVNWVTLQSKTTTRKISIISVHPAPTIKVTIGLLPEYVNNLNKLVEKLYIDNGNSPVLLGGDMNIQYNSAGYHSSGLGNEYYTNTYDKFGKLITGDHRDGTIDYMFSKTDINLNPLDHKVWEQYSDHKALMSNWVLSTPVKLLPAQIPTAVLNPLEQKTESSSLAN